MVALKRKNRMLKYIFKKPNKLRCLNGKRHRSSYQNMSCSISVCHQGHWATGKFIWGRSAQCELLLMAASQSLEFIHYHLSLFYTSYSGRCHKSKWLGASSPLLQPGRAGCVAGRAEQTARRQAKGRSGGFPKRTEPYCLLCISSTTLKVTVNWE